MNKNLEEIIKIYCTKSHKELSSYLIDSSKDSLIATLLDLLTIYTNDKNSSFIREFITVSIAGYSHNTSKIGYNGFKQAIDGKPINCEAKPKNIERTGANKLNGGGNFTDYTFARFNKHKDENFNMLISGFVDGQLLYILEFPFNSKPFTDKLEVQLRRRFPAGDRTGEYLRSASFDFKDYKDAENLKVIYKIEKEKADEFRSLVRRNLFEFLWGNV